MKRALLFLLLSVFCVFPVLAQRPLTIVGGVVTANVADTNDFQVVLTANVTGVTLIATTGSANTPVTPATGYQVSMRFTQDATGSRTVTFGGNITTSCSINGTAGAVTICRWQYTASSNAWADAAAGGAISSGSVSTQINPACAPSMTFTIASTFVTDFFVNLSCSVTSSTIGGSPATGQEAVFSLTQDATGFRSFAWPTGFINTPTLSTAPGTATVATFQYCGTVGNGLACPANSWQNTDVGPSGSGAPGGGVLFPATYGAKANLQIALGAATGNTITITNGSNIVTCTLCNFTTTAAAGMTMFATNGGPNAGAARTATQQLPETTILSVDSNTQVHTVGNATASPTSSAVILEWGNYDDAALDSLDAALSASTTCIGVGPWAGAMLVKKGHFQTLSANCKAFAASLDYGVGINGNGTGSSIIAPSPTFDFTTCTGGANVDTCFGGSLSMSLANFAVYGGGFGATGTHNKSIIGMGIGSQIFNVACSSWGGSDTGTLIGIDLNFSRGVFLSSDSCGAINVRSSSSSYCFWCFGGDSSNDVLRVSSGSFYDYGSEWGAGSTQANIVNVNTNSSYHAFGVALFGTPASPGSCISVGAGATIDLVDSIFNCSGTNQNGIFSSSGTAVIRLSGSTVGGTTRIIGTAAGDKVFDLGGNTFIGTNSGFNGTMFGSASITGTTQTAGNFAISPASSATFATISGSSNHGQVTVTWAGTPSTTETITMTFPVPFLVAPSCKLTDVGGTNPFPTQIANGVITTALAPFTLTFSVAPTVTATDIFVWDCSN